MCLPEPWDGAKPSQESQIEGRMGTRRTAAHQGFEEEEEALGRQGRKARGPRREVPWWKQGRPTCSPPELIRVHIESPSQTCEIN